MKRVLVLFVLPFLASVLGPGRLGLAQTPAVYVIAGPGVTLSGGDVKDVYLGEKVFSGSTKLVPVDNAATRDAFLSKVMGVNAARYESIWTKKAFRDAVNPPKVLSTDSEVIDFVKRTPGAVGYVSAAPTGVTVIQLSGRLL